MAKKEVQDFLNGKVKTPALSKQLQALSEAQAKKLEALVELHGGIHIDPATGQYKIGRLEEIITRIYSKESNETKSTLEVIPWYYVEDA